MPLPADGAVCARLVVLLSDQAEIAGDIAGLFTGHRWHCEAVFVVVLSEATIDLSRSTCTLCGHDAGAVPGYTLL